MKFQRRKLPPFSLKTAGKYFALFVAMTFMNFALPEREPFAFPLYYAALGMGFDPLLMSAGYLVSSAAAMSAYASLSAAVQAAFLLLVFTLYKRFRRTLRLERLLYLALAQLPFLFLFPHAGYALFPFSPLLQKTVLAAAMFFLSVFSEGALESLLKRVFRCRLSAGQLSELLLLWLVFGLGVCGALGQTAYACLALSVLLVGCVLLRGSAAVPFSIALAVPPCFVSASFLPLALYAVYACAAVLLSPYGKIASALAFLLTYLGAAFLQGVFYAGALESVLSLLPCVLAAAVALCFPEKLYAKAKKSLLFYRENALPRVAVNRNRRAVGERLYEVSALFREIEGAFLGDLPEDNSVPFIREKLKSTLCRDCPSRFRCEEGNVAEGLDKLIAIGYSKGQVSLVDLPESVGARCGNAAGLLFACNKLLASYRAAAREMQSAREGRRLLAEQAHGVSEILRDMALEQSEEYSFSEGESKLTRALAQHGMMSSEIFVYGEGDSLTVSMTLSPDVNAGTLCAVAGQVLDVPLALTEKIPLAEGRACFILKRKPCYDAAFGVACRPKQGESACGDAYSILRIDERRFLIALSDGMGSGENARDVSDRTLTLLESFYKAKMPSDTVLATVNRLIAYPPEETFTCLDLAAVDLDTGEADIVKIGSPIGFLLSGEELRVLEGSSLPMGMLDAVHPATMRARMGENDFLLFMSDGVTAAFGSSAELFGYLSGLRHVNPQSLAEEILQNALSRYRGAAADDMTVLAVKLLKSA